MTDKLIKDGVVKLSKGDDGQIYIQLNNPPVNALSKELIDELTAALFYVAENKNFKYLVISGSQGHFSAGADLKERAVMKKSETLQFINKLNDCFNLIENIEIPTIAVIEGAALGGGAELALCCDFIAAATSNDSSSEGFKIGFPETTIGIIPGAGGTYRIYKKMNISTAKFWILSGKIFSLDEAISDGFIDIKHNTLNELFSCLESNSRTSLIAAKASMNKCYLDLDRKKQRVVELKEYKKTLGSPERKEALKKYNKK